MKPLTFVLLVMLAGHTAVEGQRQAGATPQAQQGPAPQAQQGAAPQGRQGGGAPQQPGRGGGGRGAPADGRQGGGPARDRAPETGTAIITGRVVSAESGTPVRRAEVQASAGGNNRARGVLTDDNGRFELRDLPAGRWTLRASKTGFIPQQFGQRNPFTASEPVTLADRQPFTADFALTRGGAITGRVYDEFGDPIAGARVSALRAVTTANGRRLTATGSSSSTDDTGSFRVYGLAAGEYYITANLMSQLSVNGSLVTAEGPVTFAPSYFPGTPDVAAAQRLTLRAGEEQSGINMVLVPVRAVRVSGVVIGSAGTPITARITLEAPLFTDSGGGDRNASAAADGTFTIQNVSPGTYMLNVTGRVTSPNAPPEVAAVPITVAGTDVTGLAITTTRGATITGSIAVDNGGRIETAGIRITAPPMRTGSQNFTPRAQATNTGAFELAGLIGGHALRFEQLPAGWAVKSVTANGFDIADTPMEFRGTEQVAVRVILTNRLTELAGTIRSTTALQRGATVVVFPDDVSKWSPVSRYVRTARASDTGQFTLRGLPPFTKYLAIALDYLENGEQLDPEFLLRIKPRAASLSLGEGEKKTLDLDLIPR